MTFFGISLKNIDTSVE